jgi:hypothetical protein
MSEEAKAFSQDEVNRIVSERVKEIKAAKDAEIAILRDEVKTWKGKAVDFDAVSSERETLRKELETIRLTNERAELFTSNGVTDAAVRRRLEVLYAAETAGTEDAPAFGDWLATAREDATLSPWFGGSAPQTAPVAPVARPAAAVPSTSRGPVAEPAAARRLSPNEVLREHARLLSSGQVKEAGDFLRANSAG